MQEFRFNVSGFRRKQLVGHISEILNKPLKYNGVPDFSYDCGNYHIDQAGTVTGDWDLNLFTGLAERGFEPEITPITAQEESADSQYQEPAGRLTIEVPVLGFTLQHIENLNRMVESKAPLLKKALGIDELPITMRLDAIQFPWFPAEPSENAAYYVQFIYALCETAKEKKRVTAKPQEFYENEAFSMRVWLVNLGLVGREFSQIRRLLGSGLSGNSAWRYGKPEKATPTTTEVTPESIEEATVEETQNATEVVAE